MTTLAERIRQVSVAAMHEKIDVTFVAARFHYAGKVLEVGEDFIVLGNAKAIGDTGDFKSPKWDSVMDYPYKEFTLMIGALEGFGLLK